jgi:hypothetical protein
MSLSARVSGPNAVERLSSGSKEVSILGNTCMEYKDAQMADGIKEIPLGAPGPRSISSPVDAMHFSVPTSAHKLCEYF